MPVAPPLPPPGSIVARAWNQVAKVHVAVYRASKGRIGGRVQEGAPVLLLDHVGRKSGKRRTTPLSYLPDGDDIVIMASRGGSDAAPAWWLNLKANPRTTVQVKGEKREVVARTASAEEKERLWPRVVEAYGRFDVYQSRTKRDIPVVVLSPAPPSGR